MSNNNYSSFRPFHYRELPSSAPLLSMNPYSFSCSFVGQGAIASLIVGQVMVSPVLQVGPLFYDKTS